MDPSEESLKNLGILYEESVKNLGSSFFLEESVVFDRKLNKLSERPVAVE